MALDKEIFLVHASRTGGLPGGVELLDRELAKSSRYAVQAASLDEYDRCSRGQHSDAIVFTQAEGGPDVVRCQMYARWLARGVTIVEQNIFALPGDRPPHHRFYSALMTEDGLARLWLRSGLQRRPVHEQLLVAPPPLLQPLTARHPADQQEREGNRLRLLRLGRPDNRKWTDFELRWCVRLAKHNPGWRIDLTLAGAPDADTPPYMPPNLYVRFLPYQGQVSGLYETHDIYIHCSRIGESYGQTLYEAAVQGCLVVCALDLAWDCGPLDFLDAQHVVGTPRGLIQRSYDCTELRQRARAIAPLSPETADDFLNFLLNLPEQPVRALNAESSIAQLKIERLRLQASRPHVAQALVRETQRALRRGINA